MSYLDNLENNLKALENQEERDSQRVKREQERREAERSAALLRAPFVDALKNSPFTAELLTQCRAIGHQQRVLVQFTWLGETLRLGAQAKRMTLSPTSEGITAVISVDGDEIGRATIDPAVDDAGELARRWLL